MKSSRWTMVMAAILGLLAMATLGGVVLARPNARPEAQPARRARWEVITIPGSQFHPAEDGLDWLIWPNYIRLNSGTGKFFAAVHFPFTDAVKVRRLTLFVTDWDATSDACVTLHKSRPTGGDAYGMAKACSNGSAGSVRRFADRSITNNPADPNQGYQLELELGSASMKVHAVKIFYTH